MLKTIIARKGAENESRVLVFLPFGADYKDKILAYLAKSLGRKITISSISEDLGLSYGSLHHAVQQLWKEKLINIEEVGNYKLLSLNFKNMLTIAELARISVKVAQEITNQNKKLKRLNELVANLRKYQQILSIVLFGSHAKLMAHEKSDIDILVILGVKYQKNRALIDEIKSEIISFGTKNFLNIQSFIVDYAIFKTMLESREEINVGKEALKDGIVLCGFENYWKMIGEIIE